MSMPWPAMLRLAVTLTIAPEAFWRLSLKEWRALSEVGGGDPLGRRDLAALIALFPDTRS